MPVCRQRSAAIPTAHLPGGCRITRLQRHVRKFRRDRRPAEFLGVRDPRGGPRVSGIANRCDKEFPDQAFDAYAALHYLSHLDFVDPARVAVFGQSQGGETALHAVVDGNFAAQSFKERFRAAIAYYPYCDTLMATVAAPSLILVGEADERIPVEVCRQMVARARSDGAPLTLIVYPGVHHNFDVALLTPGARYKGFWMEYNEPATKDAEEKTRAFLDAHLAETSPGEPTAK